MTIPVHTPEINYSDIAHVISAVTAGDVSGTGGKFIQEFEEAFAAYCGVKHAISVSSGTAALHLAAVLSGIGPGDEVLVSALTNIATAYAITSVGGIVIPVDSRPDTWNLNTDLLPNLISVRTMSIFPVHIYGHPADMDTIMDLAEEHGLSVVEDAAEAHGATLHGQRVGSFGDIGCFSFYANKVITTGEGGMLTTNVDNFAERARSMRNLSFGTPRFVHRDLGWNYRMTNVQAALGVSQLARIDSIIESKRALAHRYTERLSLIPGLRLPVELVGAKNVYWMYGVVVEPEFPISRDQLMERLKSGGVDTRTFFCPMNLQPVLRSSGRMRELPCPVAENLWHNGLYLPSAHTLSESDQDRVCSIIEECARG